jgi:hypothetical protein
MLGQAQVVGLGDDGLEIIQRCRVQPRLCDYYRTPLLQPLAQQLA